MARIGVWEGPDQDSAYLSLLELACSQGAE